MTPMGGTCPLPLAHSPPRAADAQGHLQRGRRTTGGQRIHRGFPGSYEVILFLSISGKNSKYKIILIKVKIHHLDFVIIL